MSSTVLLRFVGLHFMLAIIHFPSATSGANSSEVALAQEGILASTEQPSSIFCIEDNCSNDTVNTDNEVLSTSGNMEDSSWWCPEGYHLINNFRTCGQTSCLSIKSSPSNILQNNSSTNVVHGNGQHCEPVSQHYEDCWKTPLTPSQYKVLEGNSSLWITNENIAITMGDFVIFKHGIASVCNDVLSSHNLNGGHAEKILNAMPHACMPFRVPFEDLHVMPDGTAFVLNHTMTIKHYFYDTKHSSNGTVNVCYELGKEFLDCNINATLPPEDNFEVLSNMDVRVNSSSDLVHPLGSYMMTLDGANLIYCALEEVNSEMVIGHLYVYGVAFMISAVSLSLSILAHTLYPRLTYHAKALLCYIASMFVMYVFLSIRYMGNINHLPIPECYMFFAIRYISCLSTFFWLSALAFDLWRVFASMHGTVTFGQKQKQKLKFIGQCLYSWGSATLLCILILIVEHDKQLQATWNVELDLHVRCWFPNVKARGMFLYAPIATLLILNAIFFTLTIVNLHNASKGTDILKKSASRQLFHVCLKLFVVMGLTWFTEVYAGLVGGQHSWYYVTDMINCLQGFAIFMVYTFKRTTLSLLKKKLGYGEIDSQVTATSHTRSRTMSETSVQTISNEQVETSMDNLGMEARTDQSTC